jgi:acetoin utilization protein AcuB
MFAIYGTAGRVVGSSLQEYIQVRKVGQTEAIHAIKPFDQALNNAGDALAELSHSQSKKSLHPEVVQAYSDMLPEALERGPLLHAYQIMQSEVISLRDQQDVQSAWQLLQAHQIHQAPVLNERATLVGLATERDLWLALRDESASAKKTVQDMMRTPVIAARSAADVRQIAALMLDQKLDGVPITTEGGLLVGFISRSDILRAVVHEPPLSLWT